MRQIQRIWRYKDLCIELFWAFLKLRHAGSVLGLMWTLVNPVVYIATYWVVFSYMIPMGMENYHLFLIPGFLAWSFTLTALTSASESINQSKYLITKISFPNEILPIINVGLPLFDFFIGLTLYIIGSLILGNHQFFTLNLLLLPAIIFIHVLFVTGISLIISCFSVFFKDIPKLVQIAGTILFFLTPIFYSLDAVPGNLKNILMLNPFTHIIRLYQSIFYFNTVPDIFSVIAVLISSALFLMIGFTVFEKYKGTFAELT